MEKYHWDQLQCVEDWGNEAQQTLERETLEALVSLDEIAAKILLLEQALARYQSCQEQEDGLKMTQQEGYLLGNFPGVRVPQQRKTPQALYQKQVPSPQLPSTRWNRKANNDDEVVRLEKAIAQGKIIPEQATDKLGILKDVLYVGRDKNDSTSKLFAKYDSEGKLQNVYLVSNELQSRIDDAAKEQLGRPFVESGDVLSFRLASFSVTMKSERSIREKRRNQA